MPRPRQFDEQATLQQAMCLFWRKGYFDTSMQDLVEELGINRASIYNTYGDKETLFKRAFAHYLADSQKQVREFLAQQPNALLGLKRLISDSIETAAADPERKGCFAVNTGTELAVEFPWAREMVQDNQFILTGIFRETLQRAVKQGEVSADLDVDAMAQLIFIFNNGSQVVARSGASVNTSLAAADQLLSSLS